MIQTMRAAMSFARPHNVMPEAKGAALKALTNDETVSDAHVALATVRHWYEWDWAGAEQEYLRALELSPGDAYARGQYALLLGQLGRADEAIAEARHSVELDPLAVLGQHVLSIGFFLARRFDAAASEARAGTQLDSSVWHHHHNLGWALAGLGQYAEALEAFREATVVAPGDPGPPAYCGHCQVNENWADRPPR